MTTLCTPFAGVEYKTREDVEEAFWKWHTEHWGKDRRAGPKKTIRIVQIRRTSGKYYHWNVFYKVRKRRIKKTIVKEEEEN